MPCAPTQVSGRAHGMAARRASLHHRDLATHPGAGVLDRFTWSPVVRLNQLEQVKDMLGARGRPKSEEMMIRISEDATATKRDEAWVLNPRQDHGCALLRRRTGRVLTVASFEYHSAWSYPRLPAETGTSLAPDQRHDRAPDLSSRAERMCGI